MSKGFWKTHHGGEQGGSAEGHMNTTQTHKLVLVLLRLQKDPSGPKVAGFTMDMHQFQPNNWNIGAIIKSSVICYN